MAKVGGRPLLSSPCPPALIFFCPPVWRIFRASSGRRPRPRCCATASRRFRPCSALIASAQRGVCFENFIFPGDATRRKCAAALGAAKRRGVDVRVIYDPVGTMMVKGGSIARALAAGGVAARAFRPVSPLAPRGALGRNVRGGSARRGGDSPGRIGAASVVAESGRNSGRFFPRQLVTAFIASPPDRRFRELSSRCRIRV